MKLLFYSPVSLLHGGGCERWQLSVLPKLKALYGHEIKVITSDHGVQNLTEADVRRQLGDIPYEIIPMRQTLGLIIPSRADIAQLREAMREADAVHFVFGFIGHDLVMRRLKRVLGTKVIAGIHSPIFTAGLIHNFYVSLISRWLALPYFDGCLLFNPEQKAILQSWGIKNLTFVGGGVDPDRFKSQAKPRDSRRLTFLYVGRYESEKGTDILSAAAERFLSQNPEAQVNFHFVGSGSQEETIRAGAARFSERIKVFGYVSNPVPYLSAADILILPSRQESFGIVMLEAMAAGTPVLASSAEGPKVIIRPGKNGWLVKPLSVESLAAAINRRYQEWREDNHAFIKMKLELDKTVHRYTLAAVARRLNDIFTH